MRAPAGALMSKPSPERFNNPWWVIGDVIGWIDDRYPAQFGRIATAADLPRLIFECDSEVRESRPEIKLLRALERGDLVAYDPINRRSVPREFWRFKNEGDLHALFARGLSFRRDDVLRLWPGDEAQSGSVLAAPLDDGATLASGEVRAPVDERGEVGRDEGHDQRLATATTDDKGGVEIAVRRRCGASGVLAKGFEPGIVERQAEQRGQEGSPRLPALAVPKPRAENLRIADSI